LRLPTSLGELRTALPQVYQISPDGSRSEVDAKFEITNKNEFSITLPNGYQKEHTLRIDPLVYSTYLGGAGDDFGVCITKDGEGGIIVTGGTSSTNFPTTTGALQTTLLGNPWDCFISKLDSTGSNLNFSTYLSLGLWTQGHAAIDDGNGGAIVTGGTYSLSRLTDVFIAHINNTGSQLIYSLVLGGVGNDYGAAIIGDGSGGAIVTGEAAIGFPTTTNAYDTSYNGGGDVVVIRVNNAGQLIYSTFFGGSGYDEGDALTSDDSAGVFITGYTTGRYHTGSFFPTTPNAFDTNFHSDNDAFVVHLNIDNSQLLYSTYLGGSGDDMGLGICSGIDGSVYITGYTASSNFPTTIGAYDTTYIGGGMFGENCFVTHLNSTGSQLIYSTYLGGTEDDVSRGIVNSDNGKVIVTGFTSSNDFPTTNGAYNPTSNDSVDCFISMLDSAGTHLLYSTYLGGSGADRGFGITNVSNNNVIVVGSTSSSNFPTTTGAYDTTYHGGSTTYGEDCFVARLNLVADTSSIPFEHNVFPQSYALLNIYPNPFNPSTNISYSLHKAGFVDLRLFNLEGREVQELVKQWQPAGRYRYLFDGKNLSSGTYFIRMKAGDFVKTQKMVLLK